MGYLHDLRLSVTVPLWRTYKKAASGWSLVRQPNGVWEYLKGYGAETLTLLVPVELPASAGGAKNAAGGAKSAAGSKRGVKLASVDFWYELGTANLTAGPIGKIERVTLPAEGIAWDNPAEEDVTLQGSDLGVVGVRMARVSADTPFWLQPGEACQAMLQATTDITGEFYYFGARLNFTLRE